MSSITIIVYWAALITVLFTFCIFRAYEKGYRKGAQMILEEWKKTLKEFEEEDENGNN